jgi:uncharacterized protein involved in outer membrane biogenesis
MKLARPIKILLAVAALCVATIAFGFLGLPPLLRYVVTHPLAEKIHRPISIARIETNPLKLTLRISGFDMKDRDGKSTALAFDELWVHADWASIVRRAILVREIRLTAPRADIVRLTSNRYNFSDLLELFKDDKPSEAPPRFSINNIEVVDGAVRFEDRPERATHTVTGLLIAVPFVSSLPYAVDIFVKPAFRARIDGEPFELTGQTKPFKESLETAVDVKVDGLSLPRYLAYLPARLPVTVESARLGLRLHVAFTRYDTRHPSLKISGDAELRDLALGEPASKGRSPLVKFDRLAVPIVSADVFEQDVKLGDIVLEAPDVRIERERDGTINLARLAGPPDRPAQAASRADSPKPHDGPSLKLDIGSVKVVGGHISFTDAVPTPSVDVEISGLAATLKRYRLGGSEPSRLDLAADVGAGETVEWHGAVRPQPLAADGEASLHGVRVARYAPYYAAALRPYALEAGPLDLAAHVTLADGGKTVRVDRAHAAVDSFALRRSDTPDPLASVDGLEIDGATWSGAEAPIELGRLSFRKARALGTIRLGEVRLSGGTYDTVRSRLALASARLREVQVAELARIDALDAGGLAVDLAARSVSLAELASAGGRIAIVRDAHGDLGFDRVVKLPVAAPAAQEPAITAPPRAKPWKVQIERLALSRYAAKFDDHALPRPVTLTADAIQITARHLSTERGSRADADVRFVLNRQGQVHLSGKTGADPLYAAWNVDVKAVSVSPFEGYFGSTLGVDVASGDVSATGRLTLARDDQGRYPVRFEGDAGVTGFLSRERDNGEEFLKWSSLAVTGITATTVPTTLDIKQIALEDFYSRLILYQNGRLNLERILASGTPAETATPAAAAAAPASPTPKPVKGRVTPSASPPPAQAAAEPVPIRIERISLQGGRVNFSDFFVKPNYSANLTDLAGSVTGMTSQADTQADVDIRGKLEGSAPLRISGRVNPLRKDLALDVKADVKDFELSPLTPYSGKYLGYAIEKGTLSFTVHYKVEARKLSAENQLILNQLTFGDKVESPVATRLPVLLAISLLKDRNGVIDVNLPIGGTLDDPQFSVGGLVWRAILNLLGRAITAPFAMLGAALGHGDNQLSYIDFEPGRATLTQAARGKLATLGKALADRPGLKLEVSGEAGPDADRDGYKRYVLEQKLKALKVEQSGRRKPAPTAADVAIEPGEIDALTKGVYRKETFAKPKNILGLAKDLPRPEMEQLILANIPAGDEELRRLARERAEAVRNFLVEQAKIAPERVSVTDGRTDTSTAKDKETGPPKSRVTFALK